MNAKSFGNPCKSLLVQHKIILLAAAAVSAQSSYAFPVVSTASRNISFSDAPLMGVNLSGCEFTNNGALCPTARSVRIYLNKGFRAFRIPFRSVQANDPTVVAKIKTAADAATAQGAYVILDRHDYGETFSPFQAAWWVSFIRNFPDATHIMIDTMNEPRSGASYQPDAQGRSYATDVNAGIAAFRKAGFKHKLLIEWKGSSGMSRFSKNEQAGKPCQSPACSFDRAGGLKDPLGLTMISGHRYFDEDGSGTHASCISGKAGAKFVSNTEHGAAARGLKLWVGESAFGNAQGVNATCNAIGKAVIARMKLAPQVYSGVTWWGGGEGWKESYIFKIEPSKGTFAAANPTPYLLTLTGR